MLPQDMDPTGFNFTKTVHTTFNDTTDPSKVQLPPLLTVCVIGASRGIGAFIAYAYAAAKASTLVLAARSIDQLESVAHDVRRINSAIALHIVACDVACDSSVSDLARKVKQDVGRLDVVICNSGFAGPLITRVTDGSPADFERNFAVNAVGTYLVAHHLVPLLLSSSGGAKIFVAVSAAAAWITEGPIVNPAYCVSKLAQLRLVEYIATQYREAGLLAVAVHPGAVRTKMAETAPVEFVPYLVDDIALCGAFCVWLTKARDSNLWLSGRFLSAKWDVEELLAMKEDIVSKDLLKAKLHLL